MKYVMIFHANLNYAFLEPHKYEQVIRASYETIIDTFRTACRTARYVFEASGFTIDTIAAVCPDVLAKLKNAVRSGQCEFMGSPYGHPMLSNFPEEDGRWANEFSMRSYEKHLGFRPESGWNPECGWMQYVPRTFRDVGYKYLTLDFESYKISTDPVYAAVERHHDRTLKWGGNLPWYDLSADDPALHFPFADVVPGLGGFCRSDRLAGKAIGYFLGGCSLDDFMANVATWSGNRADGALIIAADDAEYCGTTAYFFVKHYDDYSKSFAIDPGAREKLTRLVQAVSHAGELTTFKDICQLPPLTAQYHVEDRWAWHRVFSDAWRLSPEAVHFDTAVAGLRARLQLCLARRTVLHEDLVERAWFHLTCAENSDGRWPPPPSRRCPFNIRWVQEHIAHAENCIARLEELVDQTPVRAARHASEQNSISPDIENVHALHTK